MGKSCSCRFSAQWTSHKKSWTTKLTQHFPCNIIFYKLYKNSKKILTKLWWIIYIQQQIKTLTPKICTFEVFKFLNTKKLRFLKPTFQPCTKKAYKHAIKLQYLTKPQHSFPYLPHKKFKKNEILKLPVSANDYIINTMQLIIGYWTQKDKIF